MTVHEIIPGCVEYVPNFLGPAEQVRAFRSCLKAHRRFMMSRFDPWAGHPYAPTSKLPVRMVYVYDPTVGWVGSVGMVNLLCRLREMGRQFDLNVNSVLVNLYRNGDDSLGYHNDVEPELGSQPTILTLSLGAMRSMELRPQADTKQLIELEMESGSLLIMKGRCQLDWFHGILEQPEVRRPRISLTLREVNRGVSGDR